MNNKKPYTEEEIESIFESICNKIESGDSLRSALNNKEMPSSQTFYIWLDKSNERSKQYARACEIRADVMVDDIIAISDNSGNDKMTIESGVEVVNHEAIQRDRLRVDARKWAASKLNPKKYGDKLDLSGDTSLTINVKFDE